MDSSIYILMDLLILGSGLYILYAYFLMVKKGEIKENILLSKNVQLSKCKDKAGYIKYIAPKLLVFGIGAAICGIVSIVNDYLLTTGYVYYVVVVLFLILLGWFAMITRKANKLFW